MKQSLLSKAITKIKCVLREVIAAIRTIIVIIIGVPCIACYVLIEEYKRHRDMKSIYRDIDRFLARHRDGHNYEEISKNTW